VVPAAVARAASSMRTWAAHRPHRLGRGPQWGRARGGGEAGTAARESKEADLMECNCGGVREVGGVVALRRWAATGRRDRIMVEQMGAP
jgi:hypothetical protein